VVAHQGPGVVDQDLLGDPAKVPEGPLHALEPGTLALVAEGPHIAAPRVPEGRHKDRHPTELSTHLQAPAAEVDLHLLTRSALKAHRGPCLGPQLPAQRRTGPLHRA
jgi:hypothetical protein